MTDQPWGSRPVMIRTRSAVAELPGTVTVVIDDREIAVTCAAAHGFLRHADGGISILDSAGIEVAEFPPGVL